ncbi:uncharacterized protein LOC127875375 [Dreissena polymorpha]|uniref:uncharacterized protein LOC127875375 n=1 Tax=Dreissena polymorpha TaxID=45954 RepID=UPI002264A444|nr:uncharacterized protein LOC127875375 [Dreissena polymorpha]
MPDNCRKSCRLCVECENIHNTLECDNWALSNECSLNPNWMNPNCRKSCSAREMAAVETELYFFQAATSRLSHNQLDDRPASWNSFWIIRRVSLPVYQTGDISRHTDWLQNPLTPTSMGNNQVRPAF